MFNPRDIIDLIAGNLEKTRNPFGLSPSLVNTWWKGMNLPKQGEAVLMTGLMNQLMPFIETSTETLAKYEDTPWADRIRLGGYAPKSLTGLGLALMAKKAEKEKANAILQDVAKLLLGQGVDFYYDPFLDEYSGVLLYDLGDQEGFVDHAARVARRLKQNRVKRIITIDPHTTYAFKVLYPKYLGAEFEVKTYFELINPVSDKEAEGVTLHDPCFFGRYLELSDEPRRVLEGVNVECVPVLNRQALTRCCGGPAEALSPSLSQQIAETRIAELETTGKPIVTMCPICMGNLKRAGAEVQDLSTVIARRLKG